MSSAIAPTTGQVLMATSSSTAIWQSPSFFGLLDSVVITNPTQNEILAYQAGTTSSVKMIYGLSLDITQTATRLGVIAFEWLVMLVLLKHNTESLLGVGHDAIGERLDRRAYVVLAGIVHTLVKVHCVEANPR